jgi:hypothetical protein
LRPLPTINPDDFWGYCYDAEPELIRQQFGEDITRHVDKEKIVQLAREHPDLRERCVRSKEQEGQGLCSQGRTECLLGVSS